MTKYSKKSPVLFLRSLEILGKPTFFVFKTIIVGVAYYFHLLRLFARQIKSAVAYLRKIALPKHKRKSNLGFILIIILVMLGSLGYLAYYYIFRDLPPITLLADSPPSLSTKIYDRHGQLLYQIYKDQNRSLIAIKDLPPYVLDATLAAEDKNFYHHFGVDLTGILRATYNNFVNCKLGFKNCSPEGGSTITQQLVKNTLLSPEKTFTRKLKELVLSFEAEATYSKTQILEMYLNQVGYGGTAYGIEEASQEYFDKSARDLTLAESAMLAGLPISPTILSPFGTNPYLGKIRQQQVLESMVQTGAITENDKVTALSTPLVFHPQRVSILAPHFVMYIKDLLVKAYGEDKVDRGGLSVTTTLDLTTQNTLQTEIDTELASLSRLHVSNGAGLVVDPRSGDILAMVGSRDFFDAEHDGQVNIVLQSRQPGSSIKPITYSLAFSSGLTPSSPIDDAPICFSSPSAPPYCPKNYDGKFHGRVTLRTALGSSYNIPATKLLNTYGITNMVDLARRLGITTWDDPSRFGLSLTLGGGEVTMYDLASVYSVFANDGLQIPFKAILSVSDSGGVSLTGDLSKAQVGTPKVEGDSPKYPTILSPAIAYQINSILSDPLARAPAFGMNSVLNIPGKNVAVKTGTTNNLRDNWTFGYTHNLLIATWVGNNDNTPMSSVASGITGASPIWARTMKKLLGGTTPDPFTAPSSMIAVNTACTGTPKYEYFIPGTEPKNICAPPSGAILPEAASTSK